LTRLTAENPTGVDQVTECVYGVTVSGSSGIDSNDIVGQVRHADPTTGLANAADRDESFGPGTRLLPGRVFDICINDKLIPIQIIEPITGKKYITAWHTEKMELF
jgi:hypothetical protein